MKVLVTGGSGFIGTNLIEDFILNGYEVRNIDNRRPKIEERVKIWDNIDITDLKSFSEAVVAFNPDYIVHLAARTDLDGKTVDDYAANTIGVRNLLSIVSTQSQLKKIIITSSKLVAREGYQVKNQFDYCPNTIYGESKVITEKEVWDNQPKCDWCIIRPTSIWGPWFGVPYRNFFDMVMKHMYFHIGKTKCYKTYGYIENSIYQINSLLFNKTSDKNLKVFYIGDSPAYEINEWADEIASEMGFRVPTMPICFVKALAKLGDFLKILHIHFPMQSYRFSNMTHDSVIDLSNTYQYAPSPVCSRKEGVKRTLEWMKQNS